MSKIGFVWSAWLKILSGSSRSAAKALGGISEIEGNALGNELSARQGWLIARPQNSRRDARGVRLTISQPNQVGDVEELDLPCRVPVLLPCSVVITSDSPLDEELQIFVSVSADGMNAPPLAKRLVSIPASASTVEVPSWASKLAPLYAALVTSIRFFDGDGNLIGQAVAGQTEIEIPPGAVSVGQSGGTAFAALFIY